MGGGGEGVANKLECLPIRAFPDRRQPGDGLIPACLEPRIP